MSSFRARAEADSFYNKLKDAGYEPYVIEAEVPGKGTWYRVRLGHYGSYEKAIEAKKTFEDDLHIIAYVTRLKN
ncbi:MAG: SPOR domain-containing protein [Proteobacteria bacterium]|nr:SPOR domain-containing protein [Pseudomonadota bacterium]